MAVFSRVGCTRFVRNTTYRSRSGSIHAVVPVNPVWPNAAADIFVPHDEVGSIVSQPSAREPGTRLFRVTKIRSVDGDATRELPPVSPARIDRAKSPTAAAVPNN